MTTYRHDGFVTTGARPFRYDSFPMRLFQKAKKLGVWDPADIDFTPDRELWLNEATEADRDGMLRIVSSFQAGEEAVTLDLLPLIQAVAQEGRIEDEMYLTTFLFEEAKHVEFFHRWFREVPQVDLSTLGELHSPNYRKIFYEELPQALGVLRDDPSPANQLRASVTYNMIVEGVLAETGYFLFDLGAQLRGEDIMTGMRQGIQKLRQDESR
ncbi:MAG: R2-like ligand-binding oxidase, partial [Candidatus Dadabacteria bacterium]